MNLSFLQKNIKLLFSLLDRIFFIFLNNYILEHHQRDFIIEFQILHNFYNICLINFIVSHYNHTTHNIFILLRAGPEYLDALSDY
jgi:hypothetical protein